jgi:hypothetical protein
MPVSEAVAHGLYTPWQPTASQVHRLEEIFPTGVCDYSRPGVGEEEAR